MILYRCESHAMDQPANVESTPTLQQTSPSARLPVIFIGHGSPMNALEENRFTEAWRALGEATPAPRAVLAISAHWLTDGVAVTAMPAPRTIHDFGGFPQALFDMRYPAPGDPALATQIQTLLAPLNVALDQTWGLDHGVWSVLKHVYPDANVPVLQLSIDANQPPSWHFALGQRLAVLREQGVLIVGTGNVVHNLRTMRFDGSGAQPWAERFNMQVRQAIERRDFSAVVDYRQWGQDAALSVPSDEHFLPLLYVLGATRSDDRLTLLSDEIVGSSISMLSVVAGG